MAWLEQLLERRPEQLNSVQLRQNPHDVQAWHDRVNIFHADPERQAATYAEAIKTVDPMRATGKPHTLWLAFAKMYEGRGLLDSAQEVFRRATQANFKSADDLAAVWCERAEMELRHNNHEAAIELLRQATSEPSVEVRTRIAADARGEPAQIKLHRSAKLWCFYADLTEAHHGVESAYAMHERIHDLGAGVTRKIRMVPLIRESRRVLSTFKHRIGMQGDNGSPGRWHKFQKSESVYTCLRAPFYRR
jgi:pre-mRNA-splicing factor SYF1